MRPPDFGQRVQAQKWNKVFYLPSAYYYNPGIRQDHYPFYCFLYPWIGKGAVTFYLKWGQGTVIIQKKQTFEGLPFAGKIFFEVQVRI